MSTMGSIIWELGDKLSDLVSDQAAWSQATFGKDTERGPLGALKHLAKEAKEAQDATERRVRAAVDHNEKALTIAREDFKEEMADCLLLVLDASRRGGIKVMQLIEAAQRKMEKNKVRQWPTPTSDEPVEHVR